MRCDCTTSIVPYAGTGRGVAAVRRIEKTAASNENNGECRADERTAAQRGKHRGMQPSHQNGTGKSVPLWHGPRLSSTFAAQVIGQTMKKEDANASAQAAYRGIVAPTLAMSLDERI